MWGKIFGAMAGFAMGGPFGAVMGAAFGHAAEEGMGKAGAFPNFAQFTPFGGGFNQISFMPGAREQLFAVGVVVLAAKTAKIDGPVKRVEIDAFKRAFRIPPEAVKDIGQLFDRARDSEEDPIRYATQLGAAFVDAPGTLEDVLTALFTIANADGPVNRREQELLAAIARAFGLDRLAWERASGQRANRHMTDDSEDPYLALGIPRSASVEEARAAWKVLVRENHPDVLSSRGAAAEDVAKAGDKVARINAAWDRIKRERGG